MFSCKLRRYPVVSHLDLYHHPEDYDNLEIEDNKELFEYANVTSEMEIFSCDGCDKFFPHKRGYEIHMLQHKVCNLDGCTFSAHEKIIEQHIRLQHSTGLYDKIRNINTVEDIDKWIEERKKKYPSKANIQKRCKEQEEQFKRGERIMKSKRRFGEKTHRLITLRKKKNDRTGKIKRKKIFSTVKLRKSLISTDNGWNKMPPFKGTSSLYDQDIEVEEAKYEDDEWSAPTSNNVIVLNNALGALMGAYMSGDESDEVESPITNTNMISQTRINEVDNSNIKMDVYTCIKTNKCEDEPPTEIKIEKVPKSSNLENASSNWSENKKARDKRSVETKNQKTNLSINTAYNKKRKLTLLEKLLETEIRQERNSLLQCIRYVTNKNFRDKIT